MAVAVRPDRCGGLRCPSEHLALTWGDVNWADGRMIVRAAKTEYQECRDGNANLRTQLNRIIRRAGVDPWPKLFHNLRASRAAEFGVDRASGAQQRLACGEAHQRKSPGFAGACESWRLSDAEVFRFRCFIRLIRLALSRVSLLSNGPRISVAFIFAAAA